MTPSSWVGEVVEGILRFSHQSETKQIKPIANLNLFANGKSNIFASSKIIWESSNILTRKQDLPWVDDANGKLVYTTEAKNGKGEMQFYITTEPSAQYSEVLAGEAALMAIQNFDIRAVCMHLIYAAHVASLDRPWIEEFVLDDRQIASYLGLDKRKDLKKPDKLKLIERLALQPAQIQVYVQWPAQGKVGAFYIESSKLWEIAILYHGQQDACCQIKVTALTIRGRAGLWAKYFLNRQGQAEGKAFYQYGLLSKKLLQTITKIWQHSEGAARMLAWLVFKTKFGSSQWLIASTLMDVAYGAQKVAAAQNERKLRAKLASTWDKDLLILNDAGWKIEFDPLTYPRQVQPDWNFTDEQRNQDTRPTGFWHQLRNGRMLVHPPPEITADLVQLQVNKQTLNQCISKSAPSKHTKLLQLLSKEQIKAAREAKGWSQSRLAIEMGKSKMWVSLIETGKRQLRIVDHEKLAKILDINE